MLQALLRRNLGIPPLTPKGNLDGTGGSPPGLFRSSQNAVLASTSRSQQGDCCINDNLRKKTHAVNHL